MDLRRRPLLGLLFALICGALLVAACGGDDDEAAAEPLTDDEAGAMLSRVVIGAGDVADEYTQSQDGVRTNEELAEARPDTDTARQQYADWGQVISYAVTHNAPPDADLLFTDKSAMISSNATYFETDEGAAASLEFLESLSPEIIAAVLEMSGGDTQLSNVIVTKGMEFPPKGDESFAWEVEGLVTLPDGLQLNFTAHTVFARLGNVTVQMTTTTVGGPPNREELEGFVDLVLERVAAEPA
jgi:hypothetical protein